MNDYLIKVYRRDSNNPYVMHGIVERVGNGEDKKTFNHLDELMEILARPVAGDGGGHAA